MPTEDLAFKYPFDGPYNSFDSRKRKEAMIKRESSEQQQPQQQQMVDEDVAAVASSSAAKAVLRRVSGLGDVMVDILARHLKHYSGTELSSSSSAAAAAAAIDIDNNSASNATANDHDSKVVWLFTASLSLIFICHIFLYIKFNLINHPPMYSNYSNR